MIAPAAIQRFREQQRQLVHDAYDQAWVRGVASYTPDANPDEPSPAHQHRGEEASLKGVALLRARAARNYVAPSEPDGQRRQVAIAGALASTDKMAVELAQLSPSPEHMEEAQAEADEGKIDASGIVVAALGYAVAEWAEDNASRLDQGASVAWAGEQAGYAEAADQDGQLLQWQSEDDDTVCGDCGDLEEMGPMPLENFPTSPGDGATECNVGCRCNLEAVNLEALSGDELAQPTVEDSAALDKIAGQVVERMDQLAPSFA